MSARISVQTMILSDKLAIQIQHENKGDLAKGLLVERLREKIERKELIPEQLLETEHVCRIVANAYFHAQTLIRRRCEREGDLFRPQMMIPIGPGLLTRFGTGGYAAVVGYQGETNKKLKGASKIVERVAKINEHCNALIGPLIRNPTWDIFHVEQEVFGYKKRADDDEPFHIVGVDWGADDEESGDE